MTQTAVVAGIDCGKDSLDLAVVPGKERYHTTPSGHRALIACMRKLIVRLNAMLAHNQTWSDQPT